MYPVNQVILGSNDYLPTSVEDINDQINKMEAYKKRLENLNPAFKQENHSTTVWDSIDTEINALTDDQKIKLMSDDVYKEINNKLQTLIQGALLNIVKPSIESSKQGQDLLNEMLEIVKDRKTKIVKESNLEMELFSKFREFSKNNPGLTYDEFLKSMNND